jgi:5'(3')-deoxyribonucleotidase
MVKIAGPDKIKLSYGPDKKEFIINVDLDGVISQWLDAACTTCDIDINDEDIRAELKDGIYLDEMGIISEEELWKKITAEGTDWWANLGVNPWAKKLIEEMGKLGTVYLLTSPGSCIPAPSGKMEWIDKHFPDLLTKLICGKDKFRCASKNSILIDDSAKKVEAFREYGGHAFHWPNDLRLLDGDEDVDEVIEKLKEEIKEYKKD